MKILLEKIKRLLKHRLLVKVKVLHPTRHKIGHSRDALPSQSLSYSTAKTKSKLKCEPMPNVMAALPNIGGAEVHHIVGTCRGDIAA